MVSCQTENQTSETSVPEPIAVSLADSLQLAAGMDYQVLVSWGDTLNSAGETFGFNNDYNCFLPLSGPEDGLLWTNHEYPDPWFVSGYSGGKKTREQVRQELLSVGGSVLHIRLEDGQWYWSDSDTLNWRLTGLTPLGIAGSLRLAGKGTVIGTFTNCAGGKTPWNTILTCEENTGSEYYGTVKTGEAGDRWVDTAGAYYQWYRWKALPPEHYGWVVEVDPLAGTGKKLPVLGRFGHESATVKPLPDGRVVVYMGDDANDRCLYKFIASGPGSLEKGTLYVANLEEGRWIPLDYNKNPVLRKQFSNQLDVLIHCREAARLAGGTPLNRPEDIEIDPQTGDVYVALTNNLPKGDYFGRILRLREQDANPEALQFTTGTLVHGGEASGMACPDNLAFDPAGNLWFTTDRSWEMTQDPIYASFGNNSLFVLDIRDSLARPRRMAVAPVHAEFTGPWFTGDGKYLFLSVQHPGEGSGPDTLYSHWPAGGNALPRPSVVVISGPGLEAITRAKAKE